jgi:hypothetical protein
LSRNGLPSERINDPKVFGTLVSIGRPSFVERLSGGQVAADADKEQLTMGIIRAHEFMSLDGVIDAPTWTFDFSRTVGLGRWVQRS